MVIGSLGAMWACESSLTKSQTWVQARLPDYSFNWTMESIAIQRCQQCNWSRGGGGVRPRVCLRWTTSRPTKKPDSPAKKPRCELGAKPAANYYSRPLGSIEYPFIAINPRATLVVRVSILSISRIDQFENYPYEIEILEATLPFKQIII